MRFRCSRVVIAALLTATPTVATAQEGPSEVLATVQRFFDAMATRDTSLAKAVLVLDATYFSVRETDGIPVTSTSTHRAFVERLGTMDHLWQERMWDAEIRVHGPIATVWAPYDFHVDGVFSHCGVDAFSLIRTTAGWKIAGVIYTIEQDCEDREPSP